MKISLIRIDNEDYYVCKCEEAHAMGAGETPEKAFNSFLDSLCGQARDLMSEDDSGLTVGAQKVKRYLREQLLGEAKPVHLLTELEAAKRAAGEQ